MEEILASIRRIIADDQPLGASASHEPDASLAGLPAPEIQTPALPMASETAQAAAPEPNAADLPPEHGMVKAPQFVSPDGTAGFADTPHPLAPQPTPEPAAPHEAEYAPASETRSVAVSEPDPHEAALAAMHDDVDMRAAIHELNEDTLYEAVAEEPPVQDHKPHEPIPPRDEPEASATAGLFSDATSQSLASAFNTLAISRLADDSQELRGLAREMMRPLLKDWLDAHLPSLVESIIREEIDRMARRAR